MKIFRILLFVFVGLTLVFASTQVLASPVDMPNAQGPQVTKTPHGKGNDKATQNAEDKTTNQNDKQHGKHENFKGTVAAVDSANITLTLRDGSSVTVGLTSDTRIKFPGPKDSAPTNIEVGANAMVQAIRDESGNLTARAVMIIPGKPSKIHRVGVVTAYTAGSSITIQDKDGNTFTFTLTGETKLLPADRANQLAIGSRVTIIALRDPASGGVTVKGIVIHPAKP
jgi:hypothetical protein